MGFGLKCSLLKSGELSLALDSGIGERKFV